MLLHSPSSSLSVESVSIVPPGDQKVIVQDVTFALEAGHGLGVIGPERIGQVVAGGAWAGRRLAARARGKVRFDGCRTRSVVVRRARLPHRLICRQDVETFAGTVARISAVSIPKPVPRAFIAAAKEAGVHEMIIKMRDGYDTQIGEQAPRCRPAGAARGAGAGALRQSVPYCPG